MRKGVYRDESLAQISSDTMTSLTREIADKYIFEQEDT